jgi:hypothetical protein
MHDFRQLGRMTPQELAYWSTPKQSTGVGLGPDAAEYETSVPPADSAATARMIVKAAAARDGGGPVLSVKLSDAAQAILAAGAKRRSGG